MGAAWAVSGNGRVLFIVDGPDNVPHLCVLMMGNYRQLVNSKRNRVSCRERGTRDRDKRR